MVHHTSHDKPHTEPCWDSVQYMYDVAAARTFLLYRILVSCVHTHLILNKKWCCVHFARTSKKAP